jgi:hypothetical protein
MGVTSIDLFRGFQDGGYVNGVSEMIKEEEANKIKGAGTGAKVFMNPASSWSTNMKTGKSFAGGGGVVFSKNVPTHFVFMHQDQKVSSIAAGEGNVFGHYTNSEYESVLIGQASTSLTPAKKGAVMKVSQLQTRPEPAPDILDGFGIFHALPDGRVYWITNELVQLCVFIDLDDFKSRRPLEMSMGDASQQQSSIPRQLIHGTLLDYVG